MKAFGYNDHTVRIHHRMLNASFGLLIASCLVLCMVKLKVYLLSDMSTREKYFFSGAVSDNTKGYVARVNDLLKRYISKYGLDQYKLNPLVNNDGNTYFTLGHGIMSFYLPPDGDINGLRLIGINKFDSEEDSMFYYNSKLPDHLLLQRQYPERRIFETKFSAEDGNNRIAVKSITINEGILSVPLVPNSMFWKKDVVCNTDSLFKDFLFIKMANAWLPLGEAERIDKTKYFNPYGLQVDDSIAFYKASNQFELAKNALLNNHRVYELDFGPGKFLKISKMRDTLYLNAENIGDVEVLDAKSTGRKYARSATQYAIPVRSQNFELKFKNLQANRIYTVYCTRENPFNDLSFIVYHNHNNFRYAIGPKETDKFTALLSHKIPEIENVFYDRRQPKSNADFAITNNPFTSKYLESEIYSYLAGRDTLSDYFRSSGRDSSIKMGVVLMNTATAEVIAAPWYDKATEYKADYKELTNYNFINHPIGSCFKPLLMFATYCKYPRLSKLKLNPAMISNPGDFIQYKKGELPRDVTILNYPSKGFNSHSPDVTDDLNFALAHSSNLYPAITFLYSLTENNRNTKYRDSILKGVFPISLYNGGGDKHSIACNVIGNQLYANQIIQTTLPQIYRQVYNIEDKDILTNNRDLYDYDYWDRSYTVSYDADTGRAPSKKLVNYSYLCPERVSLHFDLFTFNQLNENPGNFKQEVVPWILGSQNNRWNNIKVCEAFCRLITGTALKGAFLPSGKSAQADKPGAVFNAFFKQGYPSLNEFEVAHVDLLTALNYSANPRQKDAGTWHKVGARVDDLSKSTGKHSKFVILAKTGTSDDEKVLDNAYINKADNEKTVHRGQFMFCIMTEAQFETLKKYIESGYKAELYPRDLGITGVVSLELKDRGDTKREVFGSAYAKEFLTYNPSMVRNLVLLNKELFK